MSDMIETALAQFSDSEVAIAAVREYGNFTVAVDGIGKVTEARKQVKRLRVDIEKRRKELNEGALKYQRAVNEEAKRLTALIVPIEQALSAEEGSYEEAKRREREAKEAEKRAELNRRLNALGLAGVVVSDLSRIEAMSENEFHDYLHTETRKAEEARKAAEELRRKADEQREQERREAAEMAAKLAAERAAMEAEREELRRQQEEMRRVQEAERAKEEQRRKDAEAAERKAAEEARAAAAKPELEKLASVLSAMAVAGGKTLAACGPCWWSNELNMRFDRFAESMRTVVKGGQS